MEDFQAKAANYDKHLEGELLLGQPVRCSSNSLQTFGSCVRAVGWCCKQEKGISVYYERHRPGVTGALMHLNCGCQAAGCDQLSLSVLFPQCGQNHASLVHPSEMHMVHVVVPPPLVAAGFFLKLWSLMHSNLPRVWVSWNLVGRVDLYLCRCQLMHQVAFQSQVVCEAEARQCQGLLT